MIVFVYEIIDESFTNFVRGQKRFKSFAIINIRRFELELNHLISLKQLYLNEYTSIILRFLIIYN